MTIAVPRASPRTPPLPTFIATTTNGSGMGHLSRQVAIAGALRGRIDPVVFSLSTALGTVLASAPGVVRGEYCPSYQRQQMPTRDWHAYLRDRIVAIVRETGAGAVGFDGVTPYLGLLRARALLPEVPFVWFRRGMWRPAANVRALRAAPFFDLIVEPGDLAGCGDRGATADRTDAVRIPPVTVLSSVPRLSRADAVRALGLDPDRPAVLVNLGAWAHRPSRPGADWWTSVAAETVRQVLSGTDWQVALTRAPIVDSELREAHTQRIHVLRDVYPLASHLAAFEAAVAEAGYNGFHELLLSRVPTLFVAKATTTDDQGARGTWAARSGAALFAPDPARSAVELSRLLDAGVRDDLRTVCAQLTVDDGAAAAADLVTDRVRAAATPGGFRHRATAGERRRIAVLEGKAAVSRIIGPAATDLLRSTRGRGPGSGTHGIARRLAADPVLTFDLDTELLRGDRPVEHLLTGTSAGYRGVRAGIARHFFRVPPGWPDSVAITDGRQGSTS